MDDFESVCVLLFIGALEVCGCVGGFLLGRIVASWL
jgi:hypothetical protein